MHDVTPPGDGSRGQRPRPRVVVVGAGIAGLAAAWFVARERPAAEVVVLDSADRAGGKLRLAEVAGVSLDVGAETMLNRRPEGVDLAREAGLAERVVHPSTTEARIWSRGALRPLPRSLLGVPADLPDLARSGLLSEEGLGRAEREPGLPPVGLDHPDPYDISVGDLVAARFGQEVVDRLVEPLLGGVYAGHAHEISARAAMPQIVSRLGRGGSLTDAAAAALGSPSERPVFAGLSGGMGLLPGALSGRLDVRLRTTVRDLLATPDGGWDVVTGPAVDPQLRHAHAVVVAVPAPAAARLLAGPAPQAARTLAEIEYASTAVVTMAFARETFPDVDGSGFLVPPVEQRRVKAATYSFAKWEWVNAASDEMAVMRTSVGRHREERHLQLSDSELVAGSVHDLRDLIGLTAEPVDWHVQRWGGGLPQYTVGHLDRVRRIREAVDLVPGLSVCGAAYDGLGIPACIGSAERAASEVLDHLDHGLDTMDP